MAVTIDGTNGITSPDFEPSGSTTPTNGLFLPAANALGFATNSSERVRIDSSGNLGLGVTNPDIYGKLAVYGANVNGTAYLGHPGNTSYGTVLTLATYGGTDSPTLSFKAYNGGTPAYYGIANNAGNLTFNSGAYTDSVGSERMRLNSSGNLGLGVTPSGWSISGAQEFGNGKVISFAGNSANIVANAYYNGGWKYTTTAQSSYYGMSAGQHIWYTAPSGTAGAAISFTQAMTLDASGNLGIGTTSPGYRLDVRGGNAAFVNTSGLNVYFGYGLGTSQYGYINVPSDGSGFKIGADTLLPLVFQTNGSERARIDSSGNFGINTSSPSTYGRFSVVNNSVRHFYVSSLGLPYVRYDDNSATAGYRIFNLGVTGTDQGGIVQARFSADGVTDYTGGSIKFGNSGLYTATVSTQNSYLAFYTSTNGADTEKARIDSSGNLLVGKTAPDNSERLGVKSSGSTSSTYAVRVDNSAATAMFMVRDDGYLRSPTTYNLTSGTANVSIDANGFFTRATSSLRYKKDIVDYDKGLEIVNLLRPVYYKSSVAGADGTIPDTQFAGMIAEEIDVLGLSEFVEYGPDGEVESIRYGNMVSLAFKAIQELTARLEALENK